MDQMDDFVRKCIDDHRNPIVKVNLPAQKRFFPAKTEEEQACITAHQEHLKSILEHQRVEKRTGRALAMWLQDENVARVTKVVKNLIKYFGFQNKSGIFLHPEEMLFLLETNRLEVTLGNDILSIEKGYDIVLKTTNISLPRYRIYKKLASLGYKVVRYNQINNKKSKGSAEKRCLEEMDPQSHKKIRTVENKSDEATDQNCPFQETPVPKDVQYVSNILNRIAKSMPVDCSDEKSCLDPDYCLYSPTNIGNREPDFNLIICEGDIPDRRNFNNHLPTIYAICNDDVAFYRFSNVHLPHI